MFWKFSKLHEPSVECNLRTFKTSRVPVNYELYEKVVRYFIYSILNKIPINQSEHGNGKFYISSVRVYFRNLCNSSVQRRKSSKFFGSISEIFGNLRVNFVNLQKTSVIFGRLWFNFGILRTSCGQFWISAYISENFVSSCLESIIIIWD